MLGRFESNSIETLRNVNCLKGLVLGFVPRISGQEFFGLSLYMHMQCTKQHEYIPKDYQCPLACFLDSTCSPPCSGRAPWADQCYDTGWCPRAIALPLGLPTGTAEMDCAACRPRLRASPREVKVVCWPSGKRFGLGKKCSPPREHLRPDACFFSEKCLPVDDS